jgi:signal transduction histidine kinase
MICAKIKFHQRTAHFLSQKTFPGHHPVGSYFSAIVVFASVSSLTLFNFFIMKVANSSQALAGASAYSSWFILVAGISLATVLAAWLGLSTRKRLIEEQLRRDRDKLAYLLVSARKLEAMAQLVGSIAHDFNNVLMTVSGYTSLALTKSEDNNDEEMQEYLNLVNVSADKGIGLIKKLLSFSRGKLHRRSNSMDLLPAVENAVTLLGQVLPQVITLQVEIADQLPALKIDALMLEQIVTNLVINAWEASADRGTISIGLAQKTATAIRCNACQQIFTGETICLTVSDTGKGLTRENVDDIFQPFYTSKNEGEGSGLGMALVQNLVHNMDGHIQLTSVPGKGTTVAIFLPSPALASK